MPTFSFADATQQLWLQDAKFAVTFAGSKEAVEVTAPNAFLAIIAARKKAGVAIGVKSTVKAL